MAEKEAIDQLIEISRKYGRDKRYTIAGGGNTSFKTRDSLWIKASGYALSHVTAEGFVKMEREKLQVISDKEYSNDSFVREREVKADLEKACIDEGKRPSVETSLHNALEAPFIVHTHPFLVNAVLCSNKAEETVSQLWGDEVLYVPYTDPGYVLFKKVEADIQDYIKIKGHEPAVILLQNHGIFVGGNTTDEVVEIYENIMQDIQERLPPEDRDKFFEDKILAADAATAVPGDFLQQKGLVWKARNNSLITFFALAPDNYSLVSAPFTPDVIVYCKSKYLFIGEEFQTPEEVKKTIVDFKDKNGYFPRILIFEGGKGMVAIGDSEKTVDNAMDVFEDQMKIAWYSRLFGGPHHMEPQQIEFIDTWEVENYRRIVAQG